MALWINSTKEEERRDEMVRKSNGGRFVAVVKLDMIDHRRLKMWAACRDVSMVELVREILKERLDKIDFNELIKSM